MLKLYIFHNQYAEKYLEILYANNRTILRRYNLRSMTNYYDYILFDPLCLLVLLVTIPHPLASL